MTKSTMRGMIIETTKIFVFLCGLVAEVDEVGEGVEVLLVGVEVRFDDFFEVADAVVVSCVDFSVAGREKVAKLVSGDDTRETSMVVVDVEIMLGFKDWRTLVEGVAVEEAAFTDPVAESVLVIVVC